MNTPSKKRTWHAGEPRKKPDYNADILAAGVLDAVKELYEQMDNGKHPSLQSIADRLPQYRLNPVKVRKLLITAGVYESATAEKIQELKNQGKTLDEIMAVLGLSRGSVHSYLPYSKAIYKLEERSVSADRQVVFRERERACDKLRKSPDMDTLWEAVVCFSGYEFKTMKGLSFTYKIKGGEMFVDRKEKSITKSTIEIAFHRARELDGIVTGPKKLGVFGASYLYPVFQRLGVIVLKNEG